LERKPQEIGPKCGRILPRNLNNYDLVSISEKKVSELLGMHQLTIDDVLQEYSEEPKQL